MRFGPLATDRAAGAILAHSLRLPDGALKKGRVLAPGDISRLLAAGINEVTVALADPGDVLEDVAAGRIANAIAPDPEALGVTLSAPFTGRANVFATGPGVLEVEAARVGKLNAIDEALTIATLPDRARVAPRQMLATIKIIPYGLAATTLVAAEAVLAEGPLLKLHRQQVLAADLILTRTPGMADKVLEKGGRVIRERLMSLGVAEIVERVVPHETGALSDAVAVARSDLVLILTASATSDRADVGPAGLVAAGGEITRFGMPVDPGNLLFLGQQGGRPVVGLPGCARSPKLNGADWVIERLVCGLEVTSAEIAGMGVGGLLKEIPSRPEPRGGGASAPRRPRVAAILLAAGASSRMGGRDKLLETVEGVPMLRFAAQRLLASACDDVVCVLRPGADARADLLTDLAIQCAYNPRADTGMASSIATGIAALGPEIDAALIMPADMPEIGEIDVDRVLAAFDPGEGRAIVRATSPDGRGGHPVLFGRRFFEALAGLEGDRGARAVIAEHPDFVVDVVLPEEAALTDLDTPAAWEAWRARRRGELLSD